MIERLFLAAASVEATLTQKTKLDWTTLVTSALLAALVSALVAFVGQWVARQNAKLAARIARENAKLSANLEIATTLSQSRQEWINLLREDMAQFVGFAARRSRVLAANEVFSGEEFGKMIAVSARIRMRMNADDEDFEELLKLMSSCSQEKDPGELGSKTNGFVQVSQRILKREWEVLKQELNKLNSIAGSND